MALTDGLLAYYPLDGIATDVIGGHNGVDEEVNYVAGKISTAASYGGTGHTAVPHGTWLNVNSMSVSFWMKATTWTADYTALVSKQVGSPSPWATFDIRKAPGSDQVECWLTSGGAATTVYAPGTISTGTWYHIVMTYDSATHTGTLYKNASAGAPSSSLGGALQSSTAALWFSGNPGAGSRYFDGILDEIGIWNRAISGTEVTELYNGGSGLSLIPASGGAAKFATFFRPKS